MYARLEPAAIDVWEVDARHEGWDRWRDTLDAAEQLRATELKRAELRHRFVRARVALRRVLASYTGYLPAALRFRYGGHGKPDLTLHSVCFNVAHGGSYALIAVSRAPIGVDLEAVEWDSPAPQELAAVVFHPLERAALRTLGSEEQRRTFYRTWVRKEAYVKMLGVGLHRHFAACRVMAERDGVGVASIYDPHERDGGAKRLHGLPVGDSYVASLCTPLAGARVVLRAAHPD